MGESLCWKRRDEERTSWIAAPYKTRLCPIRRAHGCAESGVVEHLLLIKMVFGPHFPRR
jgi:hypothetical protein